uniref:Endoribonuclease Dicer 2 n=1 Tax=Aceria tosichella TaxID=561515 RepID=A0A6G1SP62_9ACAR
MVAGSEIDERFAGIRLEKQATTNSEVKGSGAKPINLILQDDNKPTTLPIKPRQYQVELYQQALKKNTIIYLGTGLGKTFIVVMLLKSPQIDEQIQKGRRVIFLAPTQDLVKQQAEYIYRQVSYKVKVYCGRTCNTGLHIDNWNKEVWDAELLKYEVLFMTPAILNQALAINALNWASIGLLIFDEVHHAASSKKELSGKKGGSQYSQILKHYSHMHYSASVGNPSTKFLGLTASLINNMPKDASAIKNGVLDLERKLFAECITDLSAIESKPKHVIWTYKKSEISMKNDTLIRLFCDYAKRYEDALETAKIDRMSALGPKNEEDKRVLAYHNRLKLASSGFSIKPKSFHKVLKQMAAIRANSGLWTLANICYNLVKAMDKHSKASCISDAIRPVYQEFGSILRKVLSAINDLMGANYTSLLLDYTQPKLLCLLEILQREHARMVDKTGPKETFSCIVFVKSRVEVVAICSWLIMVSQHIDGYDFIKANYAIGLSATMASKWACITRRKSTEQSLMLEDFRRGKLNVIVTTSVLEEGIDLPVCSTVIRYDTAETFRVYVQSRGRARQQESSFVVISELGKSRETEKALHGFYDVEALIRKIMKKDDQRTQVSLTEYRAPIVNTYGVSGSGGRWADCDHEDCFRIPEKSIHISPAVARAVLNRYFSLLSRRRPYLGGLQHELKQVCGVLFRMTIFFPSGCPAAVKESVSGRPRRTIGAAGSSAVIAAFDALYKAGEIDCHGVPVQFTEDNIDKLLADYNMAPDFSKLSKHLEGEKVERGGKCYHQYEWKLCHLNDYNIYQKKPTKNQLYKLYRIVFTRRNDQSVRQETVGYFENPTIGIIVDASQDHLANLPVTIWSHYGEFKVEYNLIDDGFEIDDKAHKAYLVYTMSLMGTFWNLQDLSLVSFPEKCLFYFVPLSTSTDDISKTRLRGNFYKRNGIGRGAIVQMNKSHTNEENSTKRFLVHEIRTDMNAHSRIPGCQETFKERLERQDIQVKDPNQPVVMVYPISKEFGRTSHGKQVRSNDRTQPVYYLSQCFECVSFEPHEAYQAYNLPEIAYQIYINVLVLDLEKRFKRATASNRSDKVEFGQQSWQIANYDANVNDDTMAVSQDNLNGDCNTSDQLKTIRGNTMANKPNQTKENRPKTTIQFDNSDLSSLSGAEPETSHYYVGDELGSTYVSSSVSDSSAPATRGRDVMPAKQTQFDGCSSDSVTSGQMYLQMANLGRPTIERINFTPLLSQPKPSSSNVSSILALPHKTLAHQQRIEEILRNFHTGMIDLHQFMGEEQVYERLGHKVDLNIKPPLKFDTRPTNKPAGDVPLSRAFIEAITTRKASSHANLEALENIGDSFLKYFTSVQLFKYLGGDDQLDEGRLTSARSRLISNEHFSHLAKKNELGYYAINHKFDRGILNAVLGSYKLPVDNSLRLKDLADMFESLIGACLVYGGEYEAILAIKWLGLGHIIRADAFTRFQRHGVAFSRHQRATALARVDADELKRCMMQVMRFQSIIKYKFNDASYLVQAFTHASEIPRCTDSYERLEFLGDAILDFLVTMTLYDAGINKDPGQMTSSRSALVNNCTFAKLAIKYKFDIFIRQKNQQLFDELNRVNESAKSDPELKFLDIVDFDRISKTLADVFEAVAGAIYLDSGCSLDTVFSIYYPMLKDLIDEEIRKPTKNVIQQLYERFPGKDRIKFEFHQATGKDGKFVECAECFIDHLARGSSEGHSRKQAKMRAILKVMNNLPTIQS